ncbi:MAG TPA: FHA domain-containing protein [Blastocatellia bacterium]|nr:FHA domain-containing protein [Blastocatellia bacterium]
MMKITLTIQSADGTRQAVLTKDSLTIGRSVSADIHIDDVGLSDLHSSIHRQGEKVWILDENSTNGSYVNRKPVPGRGTPLADGDEISIGQYTTVFVSINHPNSAAASARSKTNFIKPPVSLVAGLMLILVTLVAIAALGPRALKRAATGNSGRTKPIIEKEEPAESSNRSEKLREVKGSVEATDNPISQPGDPRKVEQGSGSRKLYTRMTEDEQNEFVYNQARNISRMMSNREYVFTDDVLPYIKKYVDVYARRVGNNSTAIWGEDLTSLFGRARRLAPDIIREFNARGVPKVVGLYIPMIESEYRDCLTSPVGAKGLFQFMAATARGYGVDPDDRCNVKKMAPAAAKYIKDRIAEFGSDAMSVALGIAGYNRSPDSVRRDLSDVVNSRNKERSFWTLIANSDKLDRFFQNENIKYVPKFFAAAIVGENPWAFGLQMNPLSTYANSAGGE